jgi:putative flippase GtrA
MISSRDKGRLLRFLAVGVVNTCFGIGVYWLLLYAGMPYQGASLFSLILGIIFSFNSHRVAVFRTDGRFFRYILVWLSIYFANIALIAMIRDDIGDYLAAIALLPVNVVLSFILMKRFVFRSVKKYGVS